jgi:hypothetical protein
MGSIMVPQNSRLATSTAKAMLNLTLNIIIIRFLFKECIIIFINSFGINIGIPNIHKDAHSLSLRNIPYLKH